ncbi:MAG: hypothetical protein ACO3UU_02575 [Minisyncoccia bacterium]
MTDQEINKIIAEYCGWKYEFNGNDEDPEWYWIPPNNPDGNGTPPDYCNDLNAMHDAEKTLSRGQNYHQLYGFGFYVNTLTQICYQQHILTATASQRAEAFVRTIDKWKE